ncbi:hypothetical protein ACJX0J_032622, partial [Zea mays]
MGSRNGTSLGVAFDGIRSIPNKQDLQIGIRFILLISFAQRSMFSFLPVHFLHNFLLLVELMLLLPSIFYTCMLPNSFEVHA